MHDGHWAALNREEAANSTPRLSDISVKVEKVALRELDARNARVLREELFVRRHGVLLSYRVARLSMRVFSAATLIRRQLLILRLPVF